MFLDYLEKRIREYRGGGLEYLERGLEYLERGVRVPGRGGLEYLERGSVAYAQKIVFDMFVICSLVAFSYEFVSW